MTGGRVRDAIVFGVAPATMYVFSAWLVTHQMATPPPYLWVPTAVAVGWTSRARSPRQTITVLGTLVVAAAISHALGAGRTNNAAVDALAVLAAATTTALAASAVRRHRPVRSAIGDAYLGALVGTSAALSSSAVIALASGLGLDVHNYWPTGLPVGVSALVADGFAVLSISPAIALPFRGSLNTHSRAWHHLVPASVAEMATQAILCCVLVSTVILASMPHAALMGLAPMITWSAIRFGVTMTAIEVGMASLVLLHINHEIYAEAPIGTVPWESALMAAAVVTGIGLSNVAFALYAEDRLEADRAASESRRQFQLLAENSSAILAVLDHQQGLTWVSPASKVLLGWDPEQLIGSPLRRILHQDDLPEWERMTREREVQCQLRLRHSDGGYRWMAGKVRLPEGDWAHSTIVDLRDVHELRLATENLIRAERRHRQAMDSSAVALAIVDEAGRIRDSNPAWATFLGIETRGQGDRTIASLFNGDGALIWRQCLREVAARGTSRARIGFRHSDGGVRWGDTLISSLRPTGDPGNEAEATPLIPYSRQPDGARRPKAQDYVVQIIDVTNEHRALAALSFRESHDELTGLFNRRTLQESLAIALTEARRNGTVIALLHLDLDHFKHINDALTRSAGDEFLVRIAERLRQGSRVRDTVARIGGDEFAVLLVGIEDVREAELLGDSLRRSVEGDWTIAGRVMQARVSAGLATSLGYDTPSDLMRNADIALHRSKALGRAQTTVFVPSLAEGVLDHLTREADLRAALDTGQVVSWFQPIVDLRNGDKVVGHEGLARWIRLDGSITMPGEFIEVAEDNGLIVALDRCMWHSAVSSLSALPADMRLSVNVSTRSLSQNDFITHIEQLLSEHQVDPARIIFEITESGLLRLDQQSRSNVTLLRDLGWNIYVDDFGMGYSSLSHLRDLPVSGLKLDRSFTKDLLKTSDSSEPLVRGLMHLADALGIETVAEGIEHIGEADLLREMGWHFGQGYLFGRAAPVGAIGVRQSQSPGSSSRSLHT